MTTDEALGFRWSFRADLSLEVAKDARKPSFMLRKLLPEYVWDITSLEGNPYSFVEVQTLLDGETIGGHSLADQQQVLNQRNALMFLVESLAREERELGKGLVCEIHSRVALDEALAWGSFRTGAVGIGGTAFAPPPAESLDALFEQGVRVIRQLHNPVERAMVYFFWGARNQFFFDGTSALRGS